MTTPYPGPGRAGGPPGPPARPNSWLRRLSWLGILIAGVLTYALFLVVMVATRNLNFFPGLLLVGAVTVPVTVLVFAEEGGRTLPVPTWSVVLTTVVGGLVGVLCAGLLEFNTMQALGAMPMIFVGLIEEACKLLVPVILYLIWRPTDHRGGIVIGVASATGFATLETMGYGFQTLLSAGNIAAVDSALLLRGILSPACHIAWTGATTAMLWRIRGSQHRGRAVFGFIVTYLIAVALHAIWDGSPNLLVHFAVAVIGMVALLIFIHLAHRRRRGAPPAQPYPQPADGRLGQLPAPGPHIQQAPHNQPGPSGRPGPYPQQIPPGPAQQPPPQQPGYGPPDQPGRQSRPPGG